MFGQDSPKPRGLASALGGTKHQLGGTTKRTAQYRLCVRCGFMERGMAIDLIFNLRARWRDTAQLGANDSLLFGAASHRDCRHSYLGTEQHPLEAPTPTLRCLTASVPSLLHVGEQSREQVP